MATQQREFQAGQWTITVVKSHILRSICERGDPEACGLSDACSVCKFAKELSLPSLPEMVFPLSTLRLVHECGARVEFLALDALRLVDASRDLIKVAVAQEWSKSHAAGLQEVKEVVKPFDWTFTTDYKGTLSSSAEREFQVCETDERIDYERLKKQEQIFFFDEVILFEDELADNGTAVLSAKIRVMASGFFVLLRFFLRVDGVLIRMNETRLYHQAGSSHILREYCSKEAKPDQLKVPAAWLTDPNKLNDALPVIDTLTHKLALTDESSTAAAAAAGT